MRAVFIDYAKAFNYVDHSIVIQKLLDLGVPKVLVRWLCSFLVERQQRVIFSEYISDWLALNGGMPQGSYFGPLIFMILINDLTAGCLLHKFVDDTTLTEIIPKDGSSKSIINDVISWFCKNLMNINWSKTKEMAIVTKGAGSPFDALSFSNNIVEQVHSLKLLGVTIADDLKWSTHVNTICSNAS